MIGFKKDSSSRFGLPSLLQDSQFPVEFCRTGDLFFCRMTLGDTTHEFERTEGVETQAVVCTLQHHQQRARTNQDAANY